MKTPEQITKLNFNDIAFFKNISTNDAKWIIAPYIYESEEDIYENTTNSGVPKVSKNDFISKNAVETKIKSCTNLEGRPLIDFTIKTYNENIPLGQLQLFSLKKTFIKALKFTGKHTILNDILNKEQLLKLEKFWLLKNTIYKDNWSEKTILFIGLNTWSFDYLLENGFSRDEINKNISPIEDDELVA